jgi:DNA-binding PadR family transcriptional regulator
MEKEIAWPSGKELEVLRQLQIAGTGMYGLKIVEMSSGSLARSAIYILLGRLVDKGFVDVTRPTTGKHPGMQRPLYKINGLGVRALAAAESLHMIRAGVHA